MYAVIETGGKQYRVAPGDVIEVVCAKDDLPRGLGPFSAPAASPPITTG